MANRTFTGNLQVEDDSFQLHANRVIVRDQSVRVSFSTFDDENLWADLDAEMPRGAGGVFSSGAVPNRYRGVQRGDVDVASLVITRLAIEGDSCVVEGVWKEAGDDYAFSGRLHAFLPPVDAAPSLDPRVGRWYDLERDEYPWQPGVYEVVGGHEPSRSVRGHLLPGDYNDMRDRYARWDGAAFGVRGNESAAAHRRTQASERSKDLKADRADGLMAVDTPPRWWRGLSVSPA